MACRVYARYGVPSSQDLGFKGLGRLRGNKHPTVLGFIFEGTTYSS